MNENTNKRQEEGFLFDIKSSLKVNKKKLKKSSWILLFAVSYQQFIYTQLTYLLL